ncbi:Probable di- and tripeptidase [Sparassis crispa]|uniref:Probable di-and tripeptidase n=1 Tax=Sparassis crispa TaxID=139825 RepID=A0A401GSR4_9APHY|nr:Probable di- and tripeptidase [Sparassis crispa]GBE85255.1 Probable di- and tripeptidase [Sparassis crispa]
MASSPTTPDPSLSRPLNPISKPPRLFHSLSQEQNSVLSLAADAEHIYSGSQGEVISVWDKQTFTLKTTLQGHTGSILVLEYAADKQWLFSASGDSTIRVWSTRTLSPLYLINPHLETDSGDLFSLVWSPTLQTLYFGCQDTSLQWFSFASLSSSISPNLAHSFAYGTSVSGTSTPTSRRVHKFFDSYPQYTRRPADLNARNPTCSSHPSLPPTPPRSLSTFSGRSSSPDTDSCVRQEPHVIEHPLAVFQVPAANVIYSAHYGYVYCMALVPSIREGSEDPPLRTAEEGEQRSVQLVTGSGDETVKLWNLSLATSSVPVLMHTFECSSGAVLSLVARGDTIYAGCQDGHVKVWDLETRTLVRTLIVVENVDVLSLSMLHSDLYTCSANGQVQRWSASFDLTASWPAHDGIVLSSIITRLAPPSPLPLPNSDSVVLSDANQGFVLVTGANDDHLKVWEVEPPKMRKHSTSTFNGIQERSDKEESRCNNETMIYALSTFVSIPSVSNCLTNREDCRQAAIWLRKCFSQLGADASLLPTGDNTNPLVLATFRGSQTKQRKPRVLFYGHYDVISAPPRGWSSDPFTLTGRNGYLYGRGATDNKGPVMAVACAAADLLSQRALELDLVLLIEGEEEAGSGGFGAAVKRHKDAIGSIDAILVSNSTWIAEDIPCITYGLRGVVHCNVEISNKGPDLHSGVEGGAAVEPMLDMVKLLGSLIDEKNHATIPGFYDSVRPLTDDERQLYTVLSGITQTPAQLLASRWREPSLTIHNIEVSGPRNSTVIPATVKAHVSLRIVPDQDLTTIAQALCDHLKTTFARTQSPNKLQVSINHTADWWLGELDDPWFRALEDAVRDEWGTEPLRIREGGSIPSVPYLEKEFACHALHLPLGQSTDQAHLPNERISLSNLYRGKLVVERFLLNVARSNLSGSALED